MKKDFIKIKPALDVGNGEKESLSFFINSIEKLLKNIVPLENFEKNNSDFFLKINQKLPIINYNINEKPPFFLSISGLCLAKYLQGVGRFITDMCTRWLIPGKHLTIFINRSLSFKFLSNTKNTYFITDSLIEIKNSRDLQTIKANVKNVIKEIILSVLSVEHTRKIILNKKLSLEQKKIIIHENITSLIDRNSKSFDDDLYEEIHSILVKTQIEKKANKIKEHLAPLLDLKPSSLDRDIFYEIKYFTLLFRNSFISKRELRHLNKIISYFYLFKKTINNYILIDPSKRHLSLKIIKTKLINNNQFQPILGILIGINIINDNEIFEEKNVIKTLKNCISNIKKVKDSYVIDRRGNEKIRVTYIEIKKEDLSDFSNQEIKELKKKLPRELKSKIEIALNPIFIHRNEEEIMRSILVLNDQLKFVKDLPQVIVNFHKQYNETLSFIVILVRLLKKSILPIGELIKIHNVDYIHNLEEKKIGVLKNKYPKEASVFYVLLDKKQFLRNDYTINLYKARNAVIDKLTRVLGEIRDYNGGIISKQNENLSKLKKLLSKKNIKNDFLLENFFYSISPSYIKTVINPEILKKLFVFLLDLIEYDYKKKIYNLKTEIIDNYFLFMIGSTNKMFKEQIKKILSTSKLNIVKSSMHIYDIHTIGCAIKFENKKDIINLNVKIFKEMKTFRKKTTCGAA